MKKIAGLARLELFFSLKRSGFHIYYLILAGLVFLFVNIMGGLFSGVQVASDNTKLNSPYLIQIMIGGVSLLTTFMVSSFAGMGSLRDYRYQSYQITFSYPVPKVQYILGKFSGIYLTNMLLFTAPLVGYALACEMPWLERNSFLPFNFWSYWHVYVQLIAVNVFFLTAVFFTLGLLARNIVISWVGIIAFYIMYFLARRYFDHPDTKTLGILLDPYGLVGTISVSVGQGAAERNTRAVSVEGLYLWNRLLWLAVGVGALIIASWRFRFGYQKAVLSFRKSKKTNTEGTRIANFPRPAFALHFDAGFTIKTFMSQLRMECRQIFRSVYFYLILGIAMVFLYFAAQVTGKAFEAETYPTTKTVTEIFAGTVNIFITLLLLVFSGESVWRDINTRLSGITGSMPAARSTRFAAKTTALFIVVLAVLGIVMISGVIFQASKDYHYYELPLYVQYLFGYQATKYLFYCILAIGLQSIAGNRYQGYALFGGLYIFCEFFGYSMLRHGVFVPGYTPDVSYSDLVGFQGSFQPYFIYLVYWLLFGLLVWRAGVKFFPATDGEPYKERWRKLTAAGWQRHSITTWAMVAGFVIIGGYIYYNTDILNDNVSQKEQYKKQASYEKQYAHLRSEPQLSVSRVNGNIDLSPSKREMQADMKLVLINKNAVPVNNLYLNLSNHQMFENVHLSKENKTIIDDRKMDFFGYHFTQPLQPGDSLELTYHFSGKPKGFTDQGINALVNTNGTFLNSGVFLPSIGYSAQSELNGNTLRKKYDLPEKPYAPLITDKNALQENMFGPGSDRMWLSLTLSTENGQTAIAPGYLKKQWEANGRSYFSYEMDQPAVNYFNIQSGRYKVKTESFTVTSDSGSRPVQLSIYYHSSHNYNLDVMMQGMKDALTYYSREFSPYQYRQLRIIEFPEGGFAQSFANTIAFSENIGFLTDLRKVAPLAAVHDENKDGDDDAPSNLAYFVTVHEVAHQWWGHKILPANTEGSQFASETMSQYSAAMVVKEKYGEKGIRKFLEDYSFQYLTSRSGESLEERPLEKVMDQMYIFYAKGICEMYALQKYIGEENMNHAFKNFMQQYAFKERPYITSDMIVNQLKTIAPDSVKYMVEDCLEKIVVYNNHIKSATYKMNPETLEYTVDAEIDGKKLLYDAKGKSKEIAMNDWIELGILNASGTQVASQKVKIQAGTNKIHFTTSRRPASLMLNPDFDLQEKDINKTTRKIAVKKV
ncbi:M1 family aminopeptidase [Chitinophagaceae bacterium MMS25-I14]